MKEDYEIYYLSSITYKAIEKDIFNSKCTDLTLHWDSDKKKVRIDAKVGADNANSIPIGYLSEEDGEKYAPYLKKKWNKNLYEACVVSTNTTQQEISKRIMIAVNIKESLESSDQAETPKK